MLVDTKADVIAKAKTFKDIGAGQDAILKKIAGQPFYNTSPLTMKTMLSDDKNVLIVERHESNGVLFDAYFDNPKFAKIMINYLTETYEAFREGA